MEPIFKILPYFVVELFEVLSGDPSFDGAFRIELKSHNEALSNGPGIHPWTQGLSPEISNPSENIYQMILPNDLLEWKSRGVCQSTITFLLQ